MAPDSMKNLGYQDLEKNSKAAAEEAEVPSNRDKR